MPQSLVSLEIKTLEAMYLREIEILKFKLLSGAFGKEVRKQKNRAVELALVIHRKKQGDNIVPDNNFSIEELPG